MKTLYLVRHAKSDWKHEPLEDLYRPLNERGYTDAIKMSRSLKEKKISTELVISSPAIRAYSTALIFCKTLNYDPAKIILQPNLYESTAKEYIRIISEIDNQYDTVFLFAHNPTITSTANLLTTPFTDDMATCSILGLRSAEADWKAFSKNSNELILYDYPKNNSLLPR